MKSPWAFCLTWTWDYRWCIHRQRALHFCRNSPCYSPPIYLWFNEINHNRLGRITNKTMVSQLQDVVKCLVNIGGQIWGQVINPQGWCSPWKISGKYLLWLGPLVWYLSFPMCKMEVMLPLPTVIRHYAKHRREDSPMCTWAEPIDGREIIEEMRGDGIKRWGLTGKCLVAIQC